MHAITVKQPFASLIIRHYKREEYRSFKIPLGALAIHASRSLPTRQHIEELYQQLQASGRALSFDQVFAWVTEQPRGRILGTVQVIGHRPCDSPWGCWANQLAAPIEYPEPIWAFGRPGLWPWSPPAVAKDLFQVSEC